jgi:hypothetical protein
VKEQSSEFVSSFLSQLMEIPIRVMLSQQRLQQLKKENSSLISINAKEDDLLLMEEMSFDENQEWQYLLSSQLLQIIEQKVSPDEYLTYYSKIQQFLQQRKSVKKQERKVEAVTNPRAFAQKKVSVYPIDQLSFDAHCTFFFVCYSSYRFNVIKKSSFQRKDEQKNS